MKYSMVLSLMVTISLILEVSSIVNFKEYTAANAYSKGTYEDLLDLQVECPNKGALKNFGMKKNSTHSYIHFSCYSSLTDANEYDESVLKSVYYSNSITFKYKSTTSMTSLGKIDIKCPVDYALSKFSFKKNSNSYIVVDFSCVGVKSSTQTKDNTITTQAIEGSDNLDGISSLLCGDTTIESDEIPGTPMRGFKISAAISGSKIKYQYLYSYHKLRSIETEKKGWAKKTLALRNSNTQKN